MANDYVIRNGTLIDGSGNPGYRADVAVKDGKIAEIGDLRGVAGRAIDADGLVVTPGFFDMHTHYDVQLLWDPLATPSCWHGVTSILMGNCGYTIAPGGVDQSEYLMRLMSKVEGISYDLMRNSVDWQWDTFGEYLRTIRRNLGVNVAAQVGHSALRYYAMGPESYERPARPEEIRTMKEALREGLRSGAIGFSTAQSSHQVGAYGKPVPSQLSTLEELSELCGVLTEFDKGIVGVNPRPGASYIDPEFQDFLIRVSRQTGKSVLWNSMMHRWDKPQVWREMLGFMAHADAERARVYAVARCQPLDIEFKLGSTHVYDRLPAWREIIHRPDPERRQLLADLEYRARLREETDQFPPKSPGLLRLLEVACTTRPEHGALDGQRVAELAGREGMHPVDYMLDLALSEDLETRFVYRGTMNGDPEAVEQIVRDPYCLPGVSDAGAHLDHECGVDFTSLLIRQWAVERQVLTVEEAVRRLTSLPASLLGIGDRGLIKEGLAADLVIFDPTKLRALPTEMVRDLPGGAERLIQRAEGIAAVLVNGQVLIEGGRHSGAAPGELLGAQATTPP
jgi:N-acyl-D-aspartate/D-glutamate deacylase